MRIYADSSFILRLVTGESGAEQASAEYRRLGRPGLFYLPLHTLEVENAIRQRAFHERRVLPSGQRAGIRQEEQKSLARLVRFVERGLLLQVLLDMDSALDRARQMSSAHAHRVGARAIDLLHVACALLLESEMFLTFDFRQSAVAKAEGLKLARLETG